MSHAAGEGHSRSTSATVPPPEPGVVNIPRRMPLLACVVVCAVTAAVLPVGSRILGPTTSFVPSMLTAVGCFDAISVALLAGDFLDTGDRRVLATSGAYLWSLVVMAGYASAFPGVLGREPPLAVTASVAPYLYVAWHAGFPIMLALAWGPWPARWRHPARRTGRRRELLAGGAVVALAGAGVVGACVTFVSSWPVLITGLDTAPMLVVTGPLVGPLILVSLVVTGRGLWNRPGPERWAAVAAVVCVCDLVLTYSSRYRFSAGWYTGRTLTVLSAGVLLVAMLASFRRIKADAEFNAAYDSLTGLANRRVAHNTLAGMVARATRSCRALAVVSLDLDHFKDINDEFGHQGGDEVLAAVGTALAAQVRDGDLAARVGGEEFLVLLPDTDLTGALNVAERVRGAVSEVRVGAVDTAVRASLGVAVLDPLDQGASGLLRRADRALYQAKNSGRDQVVVAAPATAVEAIAVKPACPDQGLK